MTVESTHSTEITSNIKDKADVLVPQKFNSTGIISRQLTNVGEQGDVERQRTLEGEAHFHRLR